MGWSYTYKRKGQNLTDFFIEHGVLRWTNPERKYTVLASAFVKLSVYYVAVEQVELATGHRQVWAAVFLVRMVRNPADGFNFGWKDMHETMGPCESECPARILDLLTPTDSEYANAWRARCRENLAKHAAIPPLVPGTKIAFDPPLPFRDGSAHASMTVRSVTGSRIALLDASGCPGYRISRQSLRGYTDQGRVTFPPTA